MHPCDAKGIFFSEVDVLLAPQRYVPLMCTNMWVLLLHWWMLVLVPLLLLFCPHRMLTFAIACV